MSDDLTERREADALRVWKAEGKAPAGICPHCGSTVSVVQRDGWFRARCSHRHCGASGSKMRKLTRAVEMFCRPDAYVLRHMGVHRSSLTDTITLLEEERDQARSAVAALVRELTLAGRARAGDPDPMAFAPVAQAYAAEQISIGKLRELLTLWVRGASREELIELLPTEDCP